MLGRGETVTLAAKGHITPLAQDTLRERKITVVREGEVSAEEASLAPPAEVRTVAIVSDDRGAVLRRNLVGFLRGRGLKVLDLTSDAQQPADCVDLAAAVAKSVAAGDADVAIAIDSSGVGLAVAANKVPGIRAVTAATEALARTSREEHGANVLAVGAALLTEDEVKSIVTTWIGTSMTDPRHIRRLVKLRALERRGGTAYE